MDKRYTKVNPSAATFFAHTRNPVEAIVHGFYLSLYLVFWSDCREFSLSRPRPTGGNGRISIAPVNRGFFFTAKEVGRRPGKAIQHYGAGQRVAYYPIHKYLFFIGAVTRFLPSRYRSFSEEFMVVDSFGSDAHTFLSAFLRTQH